MTVCYGWKVTRQQGATVRSSRDLVLGPAACVYFCVFVWFCDHLIVMQARMLVFSFLSLELGSLCKQEREVDTHPLCLEMSHTLSLSLSFSHTNAHTHAGEGRISLRQASCSGDERCGRSCRQCGGLSLGAWKGVLCKQLDGILVVVAEGIF